MGVTTIAAPADAREASPPSVVELAVAVSEPDHLAALPFQAGASLDAALQSLGGSADAPPDLAGVQVTRLHLGNEFCDRLIPTAETLAPALEAAGEAGLAVTLATPMVSDKGLALVERLLARLPDDAEVVANDLGVLRLVARGYPHLTPVAGRFLCKMVKDPRLPSAQWSRLYPHGMQSTPFASLLGRYGVRRLEMDVPPFATPVDFRSGDLAVTVHAPFGYSVKGRTCRPGSLNLKGARKFATGHGCARECLDYVGAMVRPQAAEGRDLHTFQRGNTIFYRHTPAMRDAALEAVRQGWVTRLVFAGDWNENHRTG